MLTTLKLSDNGVFIGGRGHTCDALEHPGKMMNGGKAQGFGNLGDIEFLLPDHFFRGFDLFHQPVMNGAIPRFFLENAAKIGAAQGKMLAQAGQGRLLKKMIFDIPLHRLHQRIFRHPPGSGGMLHRGYGIFPAADQGK